MNSIVQFIFFQALALVSYSSLTHASVCATKQHPCSNQSIVTYYNQEAKSYDTGYSTPLCRAEDKIVIHFITPLLSEKKVLDIGCGTGILLDYLLLNKYFGIDISPEMIRIAKTKHPKHHFAVADMEQAIKEIHPESYDCIVCLYGPLSYSQDPVEFMNECHRVLNPGGCLIVMPYTKRVGQGFFLSYSTAIEAGIKKAYYSNDEMNTLLSQTKFTEVELRGINYCGNFIETMARMYEDQPTEEFYFEFLLNEQNTISRTLPIEYARHALIIARKTK